jgi:hypothetical protein
MDYHKNIAFVYSTESFGMHHESPTRPVGQALRWLGLLARSFTFCYISSTRDQRQTTAQRSDTLHGYPQLYKPSDTSRCPPPK